MIVLVNLELGEAYRSVVPFLLVLFIVVLLITYVPALLLGAG
jgi:TRAP-type C4-dicarboxylate transport system permease large subunit